MGRDERMNLERKGLCSGLHQSQRQGHSSRPTLSLPQPVRHSMKRAIQSRNKTGNDRVLQKHVMEIESEYVESTV